MVCGGANDTGGYHLAVFSEDVAFAYHFVATYPPLHGYLSAPTLPPCRSASGIDYPSKKLSKMAAIHNQHVIHSIVDAYIEYK